MKILFPVLLIIGWVAFSADGAPSALTRLPLTNCEIVWSAPTNQWPATLWIYKVEPQHFLADELSKLLALTGLTEADKYSTFANDGITDKLALRYKSADGSKRLGIYPSLGLIEFKDNKAKAINQYQPVMHIPSPDAAAQAGIALLSQLGIKVTDLATNPLNDELNLHWEKETIDYYDAANKSAKTLTNMCGVFFLRQIDGINFKGIGLNGGAEIAFGNNASLAELKLSWRKLIRFENRKCASPADIIADIKSGTIRLPAKAVDCGEIRTLTIIQATPLYAGNFGDEREDYIMPFLNLQARLIGSLKETNFTFETSIFAVKGSVPNKGK